VDLTRLEQSFIFDCVEKMLSEVDPRHEGCASVRVAADADVSSECNPSPDKGYEAEDRNGEKHLHDQEKDIKA